MVDKKLFKIIYCVDADVFFDLWGNNAYPRYSKNVNKPVWNHFNKLIREGRVISVGAIREDLMKDSDKKFQTWVIKNDLMFKKYTEDQVAILRRIVNKHPSYTKTFKNYSDPILVAYAGSIDENVLTLEQRTAGTALPDPPKVPDLCDLEGITRKHMNDFVVDEAIL